jgi:hypothetical protein
LLREDPSGFAWDKQSMAVLGPRHGPPRVTASGKIRRYVPNVRGPEAARPGYGRVREGCRIWTSDEGNGLIPASGLSEAGWTGYGRVTKNSNVNRLRSGNEKLKREPVTVG